MFLHSVHASYVEQTCATCSQTIRIWTRQTRARTHARTHAGPLCYSPVCMFLGPQEAFPHARCFFSTAVSWQQCNPSNPLRAAVARLSLPRLEFLEWYSVEP
eukprot:Pompholyxophrys_punicea_v1_NODE_836_length_1229_cov_1.688245.p4 type:complete len:102 gc:universal NODE_836_length_1229_cov_1.688245:745-440(-)